MSIPYGTTVLDAYMKRTLTSLAENNSGITQSDAAWRELIRKENAVETQAWKRDLTKNYGNLFERSMVHDDPTVTYFASKYSVPRTQYRSGRGVGEGRQVQSARPSADSRKIVDLEARVAGLELEVKKARSESARLRSELATASATLPPALTAGGAKYRSTTGRHTSKSYALQ